MAREILKLVDRTIFKNLLYRVKWMGKFLNFFLLSEFMVPQIFWNTTFTINKTFSTLLGNFGHRIVRIVSWWCLLFLLCTNIPNLVQNTIIVCLKWNLVNSMVMFICSVFNFDGDTYFFYFELQISFFGNLVQKKQFCLFMMKFSA